MSLLSNNIPCQINLQQENFSRYMSKFNEKKSLQILQAPIIRLQMKWRPEINDKDCGIFTLRHMETYMGNGLRSWDPKLSCEWVWR